MKTNKSQVLNHVGMTVTDVDKAIEFYQKTFDFRLLAGPLPLLNDSSHFGRLAANVLSPRLTSGKFAHLIDNNGVGLELFEFDDPEAGPREEMQYWKNGVYHLCFSCDDIESKVAEIIANGGEQTSDIWEVYENSGYKLVYFNDPFGNAIELYNVSYEKMWTFGQ